MIDIKFKTIFCIFCAINPIYGSTQSGHTLMSTETGDALVMNERKDDLELGTAKLGTSGSNESSARVRASGTLRPGGTPS